MTDRRGEGPRILTAIYEAPGWGGASTVGYSLHRRLLQDGVDSHFVCLAHVAHEIFFRYTFGDDFANPQGLPECSYVRIDQPQWRLHPELRALIDQRQPDVLLGVGLVAARLLQLAESGRPDVFLTTGSAQLKTLLDLGYIRDVVGFRRGIARGVTYPALKEASRVREEERAATACRKLVLHSPLVRQAFEHSRPSLARKAHPADVSLADLILEDARPFLDRRRPFGERDIDLLFIASDWGLELKNLPLARRLARRLSDLRTVIVGDRVPRSDHWRSHGVITARPRLFELLARSRCVASPSLLDAAPGILFEAAAMGCNVVATPNCGNWELCHPSLRVERCSCGSMIPAIRRAVVEKLPDEVARFRGGYGQLLEILRSEAGIEVAG